MRTSLVEIEQIEEHLLNGAPMPTAPQDVDGMYWQARTYQLVNAYGRHQLKSELQTVHNQLLGEGKWSRLKRRILRYFR